MNKYNEYLDELIFAIHCQRGKPDYLQLNKNGDLPRNKKSRIKAVRKLGRYIYRARHGRSK